MSTFHRVRENLPIDYSLFTDDVKEFIGKEVNDLESLGRALSGKIFSHPEIIGKLSIYVPEKGCTSLFSWSEYEALENERKLNGNSEDCKWCKTCNLDTIYPEDYSGPRNDYKLLEKMMRLIHQQYSSAIERCRPIQIYFFDKGAPLYLEIFYEVTPTCNDTIIEEQINFCQSRVPFSRICEYFSGEEGDFYESWSCASYDINGYNERWGDFKALLDFEDAPYISPSKCRLSVVGYHC